MRIGLVEVGQRSDRAKKQRYHPRHTSNFGWSCALNEAESAVLKGCSAVRARSFGCYIQARSSGGGGGGAKPPV